MIITIAGVLLLLIVVISFSNIKLGAALYLAYSLLVPIADITIGSFYLGDNFVKTLILLSLIFDFKIRHHFTFGWRLILPFILYYVIELLIIPFQGGASVESMFNSWRVSIMSTLFGAFVIYNVLEKYPSSLKLFRNTLLATIFIAGAYGLFLTTMPGLNPYINLIMLYKGSADDIAYLTDYFSTDSRLFGRISSVFRHPMNFGLFIGLSFIYIFSIRNKLKWLITVPLLIILTFDALYCGVRSCIGGLVVAIAFYLIFSRNVRIGIAALVIGIVSYNLILQMPEISDYLGSIVDISDQNQVEGSSIDMRIDQFKGCLREIQSNPIVGKGYGWHSMYISKYGGHPEILYFESLIYIVLCDNGVLGIVIWGLLIISVLRNNHKIGMSEPIIADTLLVFYIAFACITGEYGYMQYFLLFYICLVAENRQVKKQTKK